MEQLKRVIIKEEFVALTGNFIDAILLNQMIYWSERIRDFDKFILEEKNRATAAGTSLDIEPQNGWIYKKAEELTTETMLNLAAKNIRVRIKNLVNKGWISERRNPNNKWDKVMQYRVNLIKIHQDLLNLGYHLQGYKIDMSLLVDNNDCDNKNDTTPVEAPDSRKYESYFRNDETYFRRNDSSVRTSHSVVAIPEITTETTTEDIDLNDNNIILKKDFSTILENCELDLFEKDVALALQECLKELFFNEKYITQHFRISVSEMHGKLKHLNRHILEKAIRRMRSTKTKGTPIKSKQHYLMTCIYTSLTEHILDNTMDPERADEKDIFVSAKSVLDLARGTEFEKAIAKLQAQWPKIRFDTYIKNTIKSIRRAGRSVVIETKQDAIAKILTEKFMDDISGAFANEQTDKVIVIPGAFLKTAGL